MMKCPYCTKDLSPTWVQSQEVITGCGDAIFLQRLKCHHCKQIVLSIFSGYTDSQRSSFEEMAQKIKNFGPGGVTDFVKKASLKPTLLFQYPPRKVFFGKDVVPKVILDAFNEAERCYSIGSRTGTTACLRKCIYLICDDKVSDPTLVDYSEKIKALFPQGTNFFELSQQIKWLGDKHVHGEQEMAYTDQSIKMALDIFPIIISEIYERPEVIKQAKNILNQGYQRTKK